MKILHFTHTFIPIYGGTTTRLMNLFQKDGNQHVMVVPHVGSSYVPTDLQFLNDEDVYENVSVKRVRLTPTINSNRKILEYTSKIKNWRSAVSELLAENISEKFDLVYGHNPMEFALAASKYSQLKNTKFIYECHGLIKDTLYFSNNSFKRIYNKIGNIPIEKLEKKIIENAGKIVVQTKSMKHRLKSELDIPDDKITVVYNGVDLNTFKPIVSDSNIKDIKIKHDAADKIIFSYFGFLDENNGIKFMLEVFSKLSHELTQKIKILFIGRGPYSHLVKEYAEKHSYISYLGLVDYKKIAPFYGATDVFVIPRPSNLATETLLPMKLLEAMAMENLVLVSDVMGMTEVVEHKKTGIVFKNKNIADFISTIEDIVNNFSQYNIIRKNARQSVVNKFNWAESRSTLARIYKDLI